MDFKEYPSYKNSGVEWLGDVPEHWSITPLKFAIKNWRNGKWGYDVVEASDDNLVCVRVADFDRQKGVINTEKLTLRNYKGERVSDCLLNENHILIERSGGGENQLVGATVKFSLNIKAVCSNFISLLEIKTNYFDLDFIQYYFDHLYSLNVNKLSIKQTSGIQNLDLKQYVQNHISFPEILEQTQIVLFLDTETARIDNLISKQEKLIELLEEQRKSIISHAVTKGLNPNAPMKDSGVEWLGHVPEHWNTKPTKYCFKLITDKAIENNSEVLLSVYTDIGVKPRSELEERGNKASTTDGYWIVKKGDIIVNKLLAWMGAIGLSNYSGVTSPAYDILRIKYNYTPEYYNYLFRNGDMFTEFKRYSRGLMDMRLRLYFSEFGNIKLPVPSIDEQQKIVSFLDTETARIDNLITKQEKLIEKLKEYRSTIISHAVTGKIDVREFY